MRLGLELTGGGPKSLVTLAGRSILDRQLEALALAGVDHVVMVVGFNAPRVQRVCAAMAHRWGLTFSFVENPRYAETNTIYSQYLAREWLDHPCFCLNGDVLFPASLLTRLAETPAEAVLAIDVKPCGDEEVKVVTGPEGVVLEIGKHLEPARCLGEFIGVARYGGHAGRAFAAALEHTVEREGRVTDYFELALARAAANVRLSTLTLHGEPVIEIDSPADYEAACLRIVPRLEADALPASLPGTLEEAGR